jgi:hypothetical protein
MKRIVRSPNLWTLFGVWALYWAWAPFVSTSVLFQVLLSVGISVAGGVLVTYAQALLLVLRSKQPELDAGHYIVLAISATAYGLLGTWLFKFWQLVVNDLPGPQDSLYSGSFLWVLITSMGVKLLTVGAVDGVIPHKNFVQTGIVVSIGLILAITTINLAT